MNACINMASPNYSLAVLCLWTCGCCAQLDQLAYMQKQKQKQKSKYIMEENQPYPKKKQRSQSIQFTSVLRRRECVH